MLGVVANKIFPKDHAIINSQLGRKLAVAGLPFAGGLPADSVIGTARWVVEQQRGRQGW